MQNAYFCSTAGNITALMISEMDSKKTQRIFLSILFFFIGFCFSSWASRIPSIKATFNFNEAELGSLLLAMPIASMLGLPISGYLVARFDSRVPLAIAFIIHSVALIAISYAANTFALVAAISTFAFFMRIVNIAVNTQAITLQKQYNRNINGSFHGVWSTGGIAGVSFTTLMLSLNVPITHHFILVSVLTITAILVSYQFLLKNDRAVSGNKFVLSKPDPFIIYLGIIVFFAAICEGGMFDWSGIYFKEIVRENIFTTGYLIFMTFMAISRFVSDKIIEKIGMPAMYIMSSAFIIAGITLAILFPQFWPALIGFSMAGFGTAAVFPLTFTLAGTSKKYSSGMAISIISTYVIAGMLLGPPLIGYLAHAFGLQKAFILFIGTALMQIPVSTLFFKHQLKNQ